MASQKPALGVHARTPETLRALWSVIASHSTIAHEVTGWVAPNDPLWWLTSERDATIRRHPVMLDDF